MKKKWYNILAIVVVICSMLGLNVYSGSAVVYATEEPPVNGVVILHTNDVHCSVDAGNPKDTFGIAQLAAYRQKLESEGYETILVDAGDFIQGDVLGTISKGAYPAQIMNEMNYDIAIPGNHEFDYGITNFLDIVNHSKAAYLSCNFLSLTTNTPVFGEDYKIIEKNGLKIGFVGVTTPKTTTSSTPAFFKDESGNWIYEFCEGNEGNDLYARVQESVNEARAAGAQIVVVVGHLGAGEDLGIWTSENLIQNTSGIDIFIDGHSHTVETNLIVKNKNNDDVVIAQTGTKLANIGMVQIDTGHDNAITSTMVSTADYNVSEDESSAEYAEYQRVNSVVETIEEENKALLSQVVAKSDVDLYVNNPETGKRMIRTQETNMGDFCADAYRQMTGADIGIINGGGIRAGLTRGELTYADIIAVHPYGNTLCVKQVTGQQILDALEWGASALPDEAGRFLQVSGISYEIHTYLDSSVEKNEQGEFLGVNGEYRVKNVKVSGTELDLEKTYTLASHNYYLKNGGDGFSMLSDGVLLQDEVMIDNQMLIDYISDKLEGTIGEEYASLEGQKRVNMVLAKPAEEIKPAEETKPVEDTKPAEEIKPAEETKPIVKPEMEVKSAVKKENIKTTVKAAPNTGDTYGNMVYIYALLMGVSVSSVFVNKKRSTKK